MRGPGRRDALDQKTYAAALAEDRAAAMELEFQGTPAFVINGRRVTGALPMPQLREIINAALQD